MGKFICVSYDNNNNKPCNNHSALDIPSFFSVTLSVLAITPVTGNDRCRNSKHHGVRWKSQAGRKGAETRRVFPALSLRRRRRQTPHGRCSLQRWRWAIPIVGLFLDWTVAETDLLWLPSPHDSALGMEVRLGPPESDQGLCTEGIGSQPPQEVC